MQDDDPWDIVLNSDRFKLLCRFLNRTTINTDVMLRYDVMSGGYRFSDESPADSLQDFDEGLILPLTTLLRFLWAYRISLIRGTPRIELAEWWDSARALAPNWSGFSPERCSENGMQFALFSDARQKEDWRIEAWAERIEVMHSTSQKLLECSGLTEPTIVSKDINRLLGSNPRNMGNNDFQN